MNTFFENIREHKFIGAGLLVLLAAAIIAFIARPSGSAEEASRQEAPVQHTSAQEQGSHSGEGEHAGEGEHSEHAGEGSRSQEVHLSQDQQNRLGIQTEELAAGSASSGLKRPATVTFNPDRVARIGPRVPSKVVRVLADLGDWVERGEAVAVMSSMKLGEAKSDYRTAKARLETAEAAYEREKKLREKGITSEAELLEAKSRFQEAKAEVQAAAETLRLYGISNSEINSLSSAGSGQSASQYVMRSPVSGTVQERKASPGQSVGPNETPIHVANAGEMWAMIDAYERDLPVLKEGQDVVLSVRGLPGQAFRGQVDFISSQLDEETRTVRARAVIDNKNGALRSGMFGQARIQTDETVKYPMVSVDAVQQVEGRKVVFVPGEEDGAFRATRVQTGAETEDGQVEITSGLKPGDVAVTEGAFDLKSALTAGGRSAAHSH